MPAIPPALYAAYAAAWCLYLPLGLQYLAFLAGTLAAGIATVRSGRIGTAWRDPVVLALGLWWLWMLLSAQWSPAPGSQRAAALWHYALPLAMVMLAAWLPPDGARRALRHFIGVSALVALLLPLGLGDRVTGNQRIVYSLLLALGAAFAALEALDARAHRERAAWVFAGVVCAAGLALQDRRSGVLVLPLLLLALAVLRQRSWLRRGALALAVAAGVAGAWFASPTLHARFEQGLAELREYRPQGDVATSMGMRLRMVEVTLDMVREHPWVGHGAGSWPGLWRERVRGGKLLQEHVTPHDEYLLVLQQGGAIGLALFVAAIALLLRAAWRRGPAGHAALLVGIGFVVAAVFNAALRDAKLALPLMLLGALAWARSKV